MSDSLIAIQLFMNGCPVTHQLMEGQTLEYHALPHFLRGKFVDEIVKHPYFEEPTKD